MTNRNKYIKSIWLFYLTKCETLPASRGFHPSCRWPRSWWREASGRAFSDAKVWRKTFQPIRPKMTPPLIIGERWLTIFTGVILRGIYRLVTGNFYKFWKEILQICERQLLQVYERQFYRFLKGNISNLWKATLQVCESQFYKFVKANFSSLWKTILQVCERHFYKFVKDIFTSLWHTDRSGPRWWKRGMCLKPFFKEKIFFVTFSSRRCNLRRRP